MRPDYGVQIERTDPRFGKLVPCPACRTAQASVNRLRTLSRLEPNESAHSFAMLYKKGKPGRVRGLAAAKLVLERGGWLTLWSNSYGSGKSYLGTAMVNEALNAGRPAAYWLMTALLEELKDSWSSKDDPEYISRPFQYALDVDVLVVDELEKIQFTPWSENRLEHLFLQRYRRPGAVTVWITNLRPFVGNSQAHPKLDPLFSRMSQYPIVEMNDEDIRPALGAGYAKLLNQ